MPSVFYVKNKPQGADIIDIVLKYNRVFIGYPAWRDGVERNPQNIKDALFDMHRDDFTKNDLGGNLTRAQKNGTFRHIKYAKEVEQGDFVIVPRVGKGECYIGKIESPFEIDVNLARHEEYLGSYEAKDLERVFSEPL